MCLIAVEAAKRKLVKQARPVRVHILLQSHDLKQGGQECGAENGDQARTARFAGSECRPNISINARQRQKAFSLRETAHMRPMLGRRKTTRQRRVVCFKNYAGDHLISHTVARAVPSAQRGLTSVFGMGTGDPSQYGHRQTWIAPGGWLPTALCDIWPVPGSLPGNLIRNAYCILALKILPKRAQRRASETKLIELQGLKKCRAFCAELILWTSRTGD
jgi:hypothetical protein